MNVYERSPSYDQKGSAFFGRIPMIGQQQGDTAKMELYPQWEYVADTVMGGVSEGGMQQEMYRGRMATVLRGAVSLENNGGFIQIAFDIRPDGTGVDASDWDGIALVNCGNGERYDIRLRTDQLSRPWQSFRTEFTAGAEWRTQRIPFATLVSHRTDALFDASQLRRIGVLAIGREFQAELAVAGICFYRD